MVQRTLFDEDPENVLPIYKRDEPEPPEVVDLL